MYKLLVKNVLLIVLPALCSFSAFALDCDFFNKKLAGDVTYLLDKVSIASQTYRNISTAQRSRAIIAELEGYLVSGHAEEATTDEAPIQVQLGRYSLKYTDDNRAYLHIEFIGANLQYAQACLGGSFMSYEIADNINYIGQKEQILNFLNAVAKKRILLGQSIHKDGQDYLDIMSNASVGVLLTNPYWDEKIELHDAFRFRAQYGVTYGVAVSTRGNMEIGLSAQNILVSKKHYLIPEHQQLGLHPRKGASRYYQDVKRNTFSFSPTVGYVHELKNGKSLKIYGQANFILKDQLKGKRSSDVYFFESNITSLNSVNKDLKEKVGTNSFQIGLIFNFRSRY